MQTQRTTRRLTLLACLAASVVLPAGPAARIQAQPLPAPSGAPAQPLAAAAPQPAAPVPSHPGERVTRLTSPDSEFTLTELQSRVLESEGRIKLVDDFNPSVVTVTALAPNQLRIRGEAPGITTVRIADEFDKVYRIEVMVERDLRELEANLRRLFPGSAVQVVGVKDSIVLRGWVTQPSQIPQIVALATTYSPNVLNHIVIGGGSQVVLSCKVMEVQRSKLESMGFNFLSLGQNYYFASTPGNLAPIASAALPFGGPPDILPQAAALANPQFQFAILGNSDIFRGFIEALKQESLLKILAEPTVTTTSGRPAHLHSGGEFPILVPQGVGTATISFRDFGIRLEAVPIVLGNGRVQLDIAAEVSERDFSNSVDVNGIRVPGISNRNVNTRVEMNFGETFMLGGLTQDRLTSSTNKIPVLGDIPYLGLAFSRKTQQVATTELIILVTPHLAQPMSEGEVPCNLPTMNSDTPTCKEFFVDGHVEVPRYSGGGTCQPGMGCPPGMIGPMGSMPPTISPDQIYGQPAEYGSGPALAPDAGYAPGFAPQGLPQTPNFPLGAPPTELGQPAAGMPVGAARNSPWPATGLSPAVAADYRTSSSVRTVAAGDADLASRPTTAAAATPADPGLIQPRRTAPATTTYPPNPAYQRAAPQYVGSSPSTR
jgi:pilus assembly protein CpaC